MANVSVGLDNSEMDSSSEDLLMSVLYQNACEVLDSLDAHWFTRYPPSVDPSAGVTGESTAAVVSQQASDSMQCDACASRRRYKRVCRKRSDRVRGCPDGSSNCGGPEDFADVQPDGGEYVHIADLRRHSDLAVFDKLGLLELPHEQRLAIFSSKPQLYRLIEHISDVPFSSDSDDLQQWIAVSLQIP